MMNRNSLFRELQLLISAKPCTHKYGLLRHLLFNCFYSGETPIFDKYQAKKDNNLNYRGVMHYIYLTFRSAFDRNISLFKPETHDCKVLIVNPNSAFHYTKIEDSILQLLKQNGVNASGAVFSKTTLPIWTTVSQGFYIIYYIFRLHIKLQKMGFSVFNYINNLHKAPKNIREYLFFKKYISCGLSDSIKLIVVLHEKWTPMSAIVQICKITNQLKVAHYPHGMLGEIVMPLEADIQLYWNDIMRHNYQHKSKEQQSFSVGYLEGYRESLDTNNEQYANDRGKVIKVCLVMHPLIGSNRSRREEILQVWKKVIESNENIVLYIKLHPFESPEAKDRLKELFPQFQNVKILSQDMPLIQALQTVDLVSLEVSGSIFKALKFNIPVLIYKDRKIYADCGLLKGTYFFDNEKDLLHILNNEALLQTSAPEWLTDSYAEKQFKLFIDSVLSE